MFNLASNTNVRKKAFTFLFKWEVMVEGRSRYVVQAGLELLTFLSQTPECWDYKHGLSHSWERHLTSDI
jgi:hypothetical protein